MSSKTGQYAHWIAIALVVLYVSAGGVAKLAGVPYVHSPPAEPVIPFGSIAARSMDATIIPTKTGRTDESQRQPDGR